MEIETSIVIRTLNEERHLGKLLEGIQRHVKQGLGIDGIELLAAKAGIQDFMAAVDEYLMCIEDAEKAAVAEMDNPAPEELQRRDEMLSQRFDAANEEKALLGEQFNQQIRAYNAKLQADKE